MNTATLNNCTVPELLRLAEGTNDPLTRRLADELETALSESGDWEGERDRLHDEIDDLESRLREAESQWETAADDAAYEKSLREDADAACESLELEVDALRARILELEQGATS